MNGEKTFIAGAIAGAAVAAIVIEAKRSAEEMPIALGDSGSFYVRSNESWDDEGAFDDYQNKKFFRHPRKKRWAHVRVSANGRVKDYRMTTASRGQKVILKVKYGDVSTLTCESNKRGRSAFVGVDPRTFADDYHLTSSDQWEHNDSSRSITSVSLTEGGIELYDLGSIDPAYHVDIQVYFA
jgi:hypothetical protein